MKWYFKAFWILYLCDIGSGIFLISDYVIGTHIRVLFKIPFLLAFLMMISFHTKYRLKWNLVSRLFAVFGTFNLIFGLIYNFNSLDADIFPTIYTFIMPIISISFGRHYADQYSHFFNKYTDKIFKYAFILNALLVSLYLFFFYITGQIAYFGFGNEFHVIGAYFLTNRNLALYIFSVFMIILSGKRSTTINIVFVGLLYYAKSFFSLRARNIISAAIAIVIITIAFQWMYNNGLFRRFENSLAFDIHNEHAMYVATSGRWQEVEGVVKRLNQSPFMWITGAGIGGKYIYEDYEHGYRRAEEKHYAHFSPIGYTFLYGLPFALILYSTFFYYIGININRYHKNFYYLCFSVMIFAAFFGASLFVDHKPWIFLGIVSRLYNMGAKVKDSAQTEN